MFRLVLVLCCVAWGGVGGRGVDEGCALPVKKLPKFEPLLVIDNKLALPADNGHVLVSANSDVTLACPGKNNRLEAFRGADVTAACRGNEVVGVGGEGYTVADLGCVKSISGELRVKAGKCATTMRPGGIAMELGFKVKTAWFPLIVACHDNASSATFYAQHTLYGAALKASERRENRPSFQEGGQYATFSTDSAYKQTSQLTTLTSILGSRRLAGEYLKDTFLSRGHLAPNADFILDSYQDLSFFYVNTAPQWQNINAGNWVSLEKTIRRHAARQKQDLQVVTGTYGVLKLRDDAGKPREIYLHTNASVKRLPVPEVFWKVVYEPRSQAAIAFVSLNNPFLNHVTKADMLCPDVCQQYGWRPSSGSWGNFDTGFIYCCEVSALRQVVSYVPRLKVKQVLTFAGGDSPTGVSSRLSEGPEGEPDSGPDRKQPTGATRRRQTEPSSNAEVVAKIVKRLAGFLRRMYE